MKKFLIILTLVFGLGMGLALAGGHSEEKTDPPKSEEVQEKKDCKKVCIKRDGYGKCIEFEEKCE